MPQAPRRVHPITPPAARCSSQLTPIVPSLTAACLFLCAPATPCVRHPQRLNAWRTPPRLWAPKPPFPTPKPMTRSIHRGLTHKAVPPSCSQRGVSPRAFPRQRGGVHHPASPSRILLRHDGPHHSLATASPSSLTPVPRHLPLHTRDLVPVTLRGDTGAPSRPRQGVYRSLAATEALWRLLADTFVLPPLPGPATPGAMAQPLTVAPARQRAQPGRDLAHPLLTKLRAAGPTPMSPPVPPRAASCPLPHHAPPSSPAKPWLLSPEQSSNNRSQPLKQLWSRVLGRNQPRLHPLCPPCRTLRSHLPFPRDQVTPSLPDPALGLSL